MRTWVLSIVAVAGAMVAEVDLTVAGPFGDGVGIDDDIEEVLPVDEAFNFGFIPVDDAWLVFWQVLPGYYLYRDKIRITAGGEALEVDIPRGGMLDDDIFGRVEVLEGYLELVLPRDGSGVEVSYQGCAQGRYCYPPRKRQLR